MSCKENGLPVIRWQAHADDVSVQIDDVVDRIESIGHSFLVVPQRLLPANKFNKIIHWMDW